MKLDGKSIQAWMAKCGTALVSHPLTGPIWNLVIGVLMGVSACLSEPGTFAHEWSMIWTGAFIGFGVLSLASPMRLQSFNEKQRAHFRAEIQGIFRHVVEEMKPPESVVELGPDGEVRISQKPKAH